MAKSPAFSFYPGDWLGSQRITVMPIEAEGAYHRLLCFAWQDDDCSLPSDDETLAFLSKLGTRWQTYSSAIRKFFVAHPIMAGRIHNERLTAEREKQKAHSHERSKSGKSGAQVRWAQRDSAAADGDNQNSSAIAKPLVPADVLPMANDSSSSSSSSSSSLALALSDTKIPPTAAQSAPKGAEPDKEPKPKPKRQRFTPPTLEEVAAYCRERANGIDPEAFVAHYEANGWIVGKAKAPMKSWTAAVITWEKNGHQFAPKPGSPEFKGPRALTSEEMKHGIYNPVTGELE